MTYLGILTSVTHLQIKKDTINHIYVKIVVRVFLFLFGKIVVEFLKYHIGFDLAFFIRAASSLWLVPLYAAEYTITPSAAQINVLLSVILNNVILSATVTWIIGSRGNFEGR